MFLIDFTTVRMFQIIGVLTKLGFMKREDCLDEPVIWIRNSFLGDFRILVPIQISMRIQVRIHNPRLKNENYSEKVSY